MGSQVGLLDCVVGIGGDEFFGLLAGCQGHGAFFEAGEAFPDFDGDGGAEDDDAEEEEEGDGWGEADEAEAAEDEAVFGDAGDGV